ncbi:MAG: hypothetical protein EHM72_15645 [Calditrichaeota bacterium]|nr:MAG: hypothetical protein EHM72_15645 [Calditrichota bacterium]
MSVELIIRLVLIGVGVFFLLLSGAGALLEMARKQNKAAAHETTRGENPIEDITKLLDALKALWEMFKTAPVWLALAGIGVILIVLGALLPFHLL